MTMGILYPLTTLAVAKREGLTSRRVADLCARGDIYPCAFIEGRWRVALIYMNLCKTSGRGRPKGARGSYPKGVKRPPKPGAGPSKRGRPKGSKSSYPTGVKRPRKKKKVTRRLRSTPLPHTPC